MGTSPGRKGYFLFYLFDGNPQFQKGTQAKHNQQQKLTAGDRIVCIMDCFCAVVYRPVLISLSQAWTKVCFTETHLTATLSTGYCYPPVPCAHRQSLSHYKNEVSEELKR